MCFSVYKDIPEHTNATSLLCVLLIIPSGVYCPLWGRAQKMHSSLSPTTLYTPWCTQCTCRTSSQSSAKQRGGLVVACSLSGDILQIKVCCSGAISAFEDLGFDVGTDLRP